MIKYNTPNLNVDSNVSFQAIPDKEYDSIMNNLEDKLKIKMIQNQTQENESILTSRELGNFGTVKIKRR